MILSFMILSGRKIEAILQAISEGRSEWGSTSLDFSSVLLDSSASIFLPHFGSLSTLPNFFLSAFGFRISL